MSSPQLPTLKLRAGCMAITLLVLAGLCTAQYSAPASEALPVLSSNTGCRIEPYVDTCGLPLYLANFQASSQAHPPD